MLSIGLLALPFSEVIIAQENYNPISKLSSDNSSTLYLDGVSPEVIYNYGDKIPSIRTNEGIMIPEEKQFRLLTSTSNPEEIEELSKLYNIEFVETFDLNIFIKIKRLQITISKSIVYAYSEINRFKRYLFNL